MTAQFRHSQVIERLLVEVFRFYAQDHVRNHPRWDQDIKLEQQTSSPIGVGTIIRKHSRRSGIPVDGTMKMVEYESNWLITVLIHDGPVEMNGRTTFEAVNPNHILISAFFEILKMDESIDKNFVNERLEDSGRVRKQLVEGKFYPGVKTLKWWSEFITTAN
jgi:hypothetical protein